MKKFLSGIMIIIFMFTVVGCSSGNGGSALQKQELATGFCGINWYTNKEDIKNRDNEEFILMLNEENSLTFGIIERDNPLFLNSLDSGEVTKTKFVFDDEGELFYIEQSLDFVALEDTYDLLVEEFKNNDFFYMSEFQNEDDDTMKSKVFDSDTSYATIFYHPLSKSISVRYTPTITHRKDNYTEMYLNLI